MATPAIDRPSGSAAAIANDLDDVMAVMDAAFGDRFGEAWTRSQCAGILPMTGVSLIVARATAEDEPPLDFRCHGPSRTNLNCCCSLCFPTVIGRALAAGFSTISSNARRNDGVSSSSS